MTVKIFDTHSHYNDESFDLDRDEIIKVQFETGVDRILNCSVDLETCKKTIDLIEKYGFIYGACGIHPSYSKNYYKTDYIDSLYQYHKNEKVLAVGEIGLDYFYENSEVSIQKEIFREQLELSKSLNKPVIIHCRDAHSDTLNIVKDMMPLKGVVHCFTGSLDIAKEWVKLGFYLGISGVITFKNAIRIIEVVKNIPIEYLLTETDCPYLSPVPYRGKRNQSTYIEQIIKKISETKNEDFYKMSDALYNNGLRFLGLK